MAKTFDNISEASTTNYLFLFSQRTLALQNEPPTLPPLNALGLPYHAIRVMLKLLMKLCAATRKAEQAKEPLPAAVETAAAETAAVEVVAAETGAAEMVAAEVVAETAAVKIAAADMAVTAEMVVDDMAVPAVKQAVANFAEKIKPLANKVTEYILDHQDDAAQEDRWRTTMKRNMAQSFRAQREEVQKVKEEVQAMQRVVKNIFDLVNTKTASLEPLLIVQDDDVAPALGQPHGAPLQGHGRPALAHVDVYDC